MIYEFREGVTELPRPLLIRSGDVVRGMGRDATILKPAPGLQLGPNEALVMTEGFTAAVGKNRWIYRGGTPNSGVEAFGEAEGMHVRFSIENLTIDGCRLPGGGIHVYGKAFSIRHVAIKDVGGHALWSECGNRPFAGAASAGDRDYQWLNMPEALVDYLVINAPGGHGVLWRGPNDSTLDHLVIARPTLAGLLVDAEPGVIQAAGAKLGRVHVYPGGSQPQIWIKAWKCLGGDLLYCDTPFDEGLRLDGSDCHFGTVEVFKHNVLRNNRSYGVSIAGTGNRIDSLFYQNDEDPQGIGTTPVHGGALEILASNNVVAAGELRSRKGLKCPGVSRTIRGATSTYGGRVTDWPNP